MENGLLDFLKNQNMNKFLKLSFIIASISIISCNSGNKSEKNADNSQSFELTKSLLTSEKFESIHGMYSSSINFLEDDKYNHEMGSEGMGWYNEGTYEIKDNKILLHCTKCAEIKEDSKESDCFKTLGEAECFIEDTPNSLYYSKNLICRSYNGKWMENEIIEVEFPLKSSRLKAGEKRKINNSPAIIMGYISATTTETAYLKESPSETAENVDFFIEKYEEPEPMIPTNYSVKILAKTENKVSVKGVEDYWYYIEVNHYSQSAWIFGKSLKF